jgi:phosphoglycolate phosphatase
LSFTGGLIVFDLDGTLVDSLRDLAESANALLAANGAASLSIDAIGRMVGDGTATLVARAFAASGRPAPPDAVEKFLAIYNSRLLTWTRAYDGIDAALASLAERATLAVLTNKQLEPTRQILEGLGLAAYFAPDRVCGGDGPLPRKPDPSALMQLSAHAGVAIDRTVLVGDSLVDWRTAHAAGATICLARYGFGYVGFPTAHLQAEDLGVDTPRELPLVL